MDNLRLQRLLETILGSGDLHGDDVAFNCPFCSHHKKKLQINLVSHKWHCWVCDAKGRSITILVNKLNVGTQIKKSIFEIVGTGSFKQSSDKKYDSLILPDSFTRFWEANKKDPEYKNAIKYLLSRNILKYDIGFCTMGLYSGMIIIPSYDKKGLLNFFTGRSYYSDTSFKHKNPKVTKNIIGFELLINWKEPITIVEGAFDAIAVKRNAIPLFGKNMPDILKLKIVENKVKVVNLALDRDAIEQSLKHCEYLMSNGIRVNLIELGNEDPSDLGYFEFTKKIKQSKELDFQKIMEYKLF